MGKLIRTGELLTRYPWLDRVRMDILGAICAKGPWLWDVSYRRSYVTSPGYARLQREGKPVIFAIHHGCMISLLGFRPRKKITILISNSRDGEMIARGVLGMGFSVARGSSQRGGVKAGLELVEAARGGQNIAYMVDGPRGPRFGVKIGIIRMAQLTGCPIVPVGFSSRTSAYMSSWDRFMATVWSSPMLTIFGEPIVIPENASDAELEDLRAELERVMNELKQSSDSFWRFARH